MVRGINTLLLAIWISCPADAAFLPQDTPSHPVLKGEYLGQEKPGAIPELFAHELFSLPGINPLGLSFTPDGRELYFTSWRREPRAVIVCMKRIEDEWTRPEAVPFSGKYMDWDLNLSPDGKKLFFSSKRPIEEDGEPQEYGDLWFVEKDEHGNWGRPKHLGSKVNGESDEVHPTVSRRGTLYFFLDTEKDAPDIYCSEFKDGAYASPKKLGASVNTEHADMDPFVAPDESYLIFHSDRPGGHGRVDLYISFRNKDGSWATAKNMGIPINSEGSDYCGRVTPDGKYLIFSSRRGGKKGIYWVDTEVIDELRKEN